MLITSLDEDAPHARLPTLVDDQPRNKNNGALGFQSLLLTGGEGTGIYPPLPSSAEPDFPASFPHRWLRLTRRNDRLAGLCSTDGQAWQTFCTHTQDFPALALLGLAVTSHNAACAVRVSFHDLNLNQRSNP